MTQPHLAELPTSDGQVFDGTAGGAFGFQRGSVHGESNISGVQAVLRNGGVNLRNEGSGEAVIELYLKIDSDQFPLVPVGFKLQRYFMAHIEFGIFRVFNQYGELQTSYSTQNAT